MRGGKASALRNGGISSMSRAQKARYLQGTVDGLKDSDKATRCVRVRAFVRARGSPALLCRPPRHL